MRCVFMTGRIHSSLRRGRKNMRFKILGMIATAALISACETAPTTKDAASGSGKSGLTEAYSTKVPSMQKGSQQDLVVNVGDRVFFDYDKYNLQSESRQVLEKQAAWLKENGAVKVVIEGHADERGTREYNLALGERRANSVKDYLIQSGVYPSNLTAIGYGFSRPKYTNRTSDGRQLNRRVEIKVDDGVDDYDNPSGTYITHLVVKEDTLFSIAKRYNVTVEELKDWKNLVDNNIVIGNSLLIKR